MANSDIVNGFTPIRRLSGGPIILNRYYIDSSNSVAAVGKGTMVSLVANTSSKTIPEVIICAAAAVPVGVVVDFEYSPDAPNRLYLPASTAGWVLVADSPDLVLSVQSSGTFEDGDIGANGDLVDAGTSTTTGASGQELDQSTITTTDTLIFNILRLVNAEDNALGANAQLEVRCNLHAYGMAALAEGSFTGVHN